jgi:hypothetical protein
MNDAKETLERIRKNGNYKYDCGVERPELEKAAKMNGGISQ